MLQHDALSQNSAITEIFGGWGEFCGALESRICRKLSDHNLSFNLRRSVISECEDYW